MRKGSVRSEQTGPRLSAPVVDWVVLQDLALVFDLIIYRTQYLSVSLAWIWSRSSSDAGKEIRQTAIPLGSMPHFVANTP